MDMIDSDQRVSTGRIITENQKGSIPFSSKILGERMEHVIEEVAWLTADSICR